jgi:hypothetical protein
VDADLHNLIRVLHAASMMAVDPGAGLQSYPEACMWLHADETPSQTELYVAAKRRRLHADSMLHDLNNKHGRKLFSQQDHAQSAGQTPSSSKPQQPLLKTSLQGSVQDANSRCSSRKQPANQVSSTTEQGVAKRMRIGPAKDKLHAAILQNEE